MYYIKFWLRIDIFHFLINDSKSLLNIKVAYSLLFYILLQRTRTHTKHVCVVYILLIVYFSRVHVLYVVYIMCIVCTLVFEGRSTPS